MPRSFHASDLAATLYRFASSLSHSPQVIYKYIYIPHLQVPNNTACIFLSENDMFD